jgi:hypothetical protein
MAIEEGKLIKETLTGPHPATATPAISTTKKVEAR